MAVDDIAAAILDFDKETTVALVEAELTAGTEVGSILNNGLIAPMDVIGEQFSDGLIFVPEMLMAAVAMKGGLELLRPRLAKSAAKPLGTVVMGTVRGDLHDIGKNLVSMLLEGAGFKVVDLGVDVGSEAFVAAAREHRAEIVGLSALLTTTMPNMKEIVQELHETCPGTQVMVGGAPVRHEFADQIGADGYGEDAPAATKTARALLTALAPVGA